MKYVSICVDKNNNRWLKTIKDHKIYFIKPNYILNGNDRYSETLLKKELSLTNIPCYIIISSAGFITSYDAFRPSDRDFAYKISGFLTSSN